MKWVVLLYDYGGHVILKVNLLSKYLLNRFVSLTGVELHEVSLVLSCEFRFDEDWLIDVSDRASKFIFFSLLVDFRLWHLDSDEDLVFSGRDAFLVLNRDVENLVVVSQA